MTIKWQLQIREENGRLLLIKTFETREEAVGYYSKIKHKYPIDDYDVVYDKVTYYPSCY